MPFDLAAPAAALPGDLAPLHGVPREVLVAHAMERLPPVLRGLVAAIELQEAGSVHHMGIEVDRIAWRAVWRRPGLPGASGTFAVWNGEPV
jgi:hypothetical protein